MDQSIFTLKRLRFRAGANPQASPLDIRPGTVTILVGPNNSGKSAALREIEAWCRGVDTKRLIIDEIEVPLPTTFSEVLDLLSRFQTTPRINEPVSPEYMQIQSFPLGELSGYQNRQSIHLPGIGNASNNMNALAIRQSVLRLYTARLDGRSRFSLVDPKPSGNLRTHEKPENHLQALGKDLAARDGIRELTKDAFDLYFTLDPTNTGTYAINMNPRPPSSRDEMSLDESGVRYQEQGTRP